MGKKLVKPLKLVSSSKSDLHKNLSGEPLLIQIPHSERN